MSEFDLLSYPIVFSAPQYLTGESAWVSHIPFAMLSVELLKPRVFVELGTHRGNSYLAFCQAVKMLNLPTRCFAVDTWQGDEHTGRYGEVILQMLRANHDPYYESFSRLMQMRFNEALPQFRDGEIDLLHIDGFHTYEAVREDFESWRPKLSDRAVVLFHDTQVKEDDFGVWKLWAEISSGFPSFEFHHGFGLGVLAVGAEVSTEFLEFLADAEARPHPIRTAFSALGERSELLHRTLSVAGAILHQSERLHTVFGSAGRQWPLPLDLESAFRDIVRHTNTATLALDALLDKLQVAK